MAYHEQLLWWGVDKTEVLKLIAPDVITYIDWYCENGIYLPEEYLRDPGTWSQILRNIQFTFDIINEGRKISNDEEQKLYDEGIEYFYKYFRHLFQ